MTSSDVFITIEGFGSTSLVQVGSNFFLNNISSGTGPELKYSGAAELINFGAFLAFLGVNLAVIREFVFRPPPGHKRNWMYDLVLPALAFVFCLYIWLSLPKAAKLVGGCWLGAGLIYTAIKTRGFRDTPVMLDLSGA